MSASLKLLTLDEFLDWEERQPERYEFDGIQPVAMTGGSVGHARLISRLVVALATRLPIGCEAFASDLKVISGNRVRYPDVTVVCGGAQPRDVSVQPRIVFEVLSPSTALIDQRVKPHDYRDVPSIEAYVILDQDQPRAMILRRAKDWEEEPVAGLDGVLDLFETGLELPMAELYR